MLEKVESQVDPEVEASVVNSVEPSVDISVVGISVDISVDGISVDGISVVIIISGVVEATAATVVETSSLNVGTGQPHEVGILTF